MKRAIIILLITVLLVALAAYILKPKPPDKPVPEEPAASGVEGQDAPGGGDAEKSAIEQAAWCVYWDPASASAAAENLARYRELVLFGCVYDEDHALVVPEKLTALIEGMPDRSNSERPELYLSFINDVMHPDGSSTQKSTAFLQEVLPDAELSEAVIDDMIRQTQAFGFDGIELDYENSEKCDGLMDDYLSFVSRLWQRAAAENLKLRVVLSVSMPAEALGSIEGPRYTVMCYNLFGTHSGPGPKADEAFLKRTVGKFKNLHADYALANGGFEWGPNGKALRSLTAKAAAALAAETGADATRDGDGAVHFTYQAEDGPHTVWYGDEATIQRWSEILLEEEDGDIRTDLWRLE